MTTDGKWGNSCRKRGIQFHGILELANSAPTPFEYVHTPKHGSWLNLIECAFSKMARTFLRQIRVASVDELKTRILKGIDEMNQVPVVFRWKKFDLGVA